ncbi:MAG: hypothetical protein ACTSWN_05275 [Promethearchaeota archaeon]
MVLCHFFAWDVRSLPQPRSSTWFAGDRLRPKEKDEHSLLRTVSAIEMRNSSVQD